MRKFLSDIANAGRKPNIKNVTHSNEIQVKPSKMPVVEKIEISWAGRGTLSFMQSLKEQQS